MCALGGKMFHTTLLSTYLLVIENICIHFSKGSNRKLQFIIHIQFCFYIVSANKKLTQEQPDISYKNQEADTLSLSLYTISLSIFSSNFILVNL